jgi:hypothetical protein
MSRKTSFARRRIKVYAESSSPELRLPLLFATPSEPEMPPQSYAGPEAFRQAIERRIRSAAGAPGMARFRQVLVFDRFLARVSLHFGDRAIVKGGVVLELRLERARTTRDVDIRLSGPSSTLEADLEAIGRVDLGDFLSFVVQPDREHPTIEGDGMVYEGRRFRVQAMLAGKVYAGPFGLDIGFGDVLTEPPETVDGSDFLAFAGVTRARHRIYPRVVHIAEKLHAYTFPRPRENSRVKDLPDLALLAQIGPLEGAAVRKALDATFGFRKTHALPPALPPPPASWAARYAKIASDDALPWTDLEGVASAARAFLDPVLANTAGTWRPEAWGWHSA